MRARVLLSAALLFAATSSAHGADENGEFAIRGIGAISCGALADALGGDDATARSQTIATFSAWIGGYLTYANRTSPETFDIAPLAMDQDVLAIVVRQCDQRPPETSVEAVVFEIGSSLSTRLVKTRSEVILNEGVLALRQSVIVAMQARLIELGHLSGPADGKVGPATLRALARFQTAAAVEDDAAAGLATFLALMFE